MQPEEIIAKKLEEVELKIGDIRKQLSTKDKRTFFARDLQTRLDRLHHYQAALQFCLGQRASLTV